MKIQTKFILGAILVALISTCWANQILPDGSILLDQTTPIQLIINNNNKELLAVFDIAYIKGVGTNVAQCVWDTSDHSISCPPQTSIHVNGLDSKSIPLDYIAPYLNSLTNISTGNSLKITNFKLHTINNCTIDLLQPAISQNLINGQTVKFDATACRID